MKKKRLKTRFLGAVVVARKKKRVKQQQQHHCQITKKKKMEVYMWSVQKKHVARRSKRDTTPTHTH